MSVVSNNSELKSLLDRLCAYDLINHADSSEVITLEDRIAAVLTMNSFAKEDIPLIGALSRRFKQVHPNPTASTLERTNIAGLIAIKRRDMFAQYNIPERDPDDIFNSEEINKLAKNNLDEFAEKMGLLKKYLDADLICQPDFLRLATKIMELKDCSNQSIMQNAVFFNSFLIHFMDSLGTDDLLKLLFTKNEQGRMPIELVKPDSLTNSQKYRLATLFKIGMKFQITTLEDSYRVSFIHDILKESTTKVEVINAVSSINDSTSEDEYKRIADLIELHEVPITDFPHPEKLLKLVKFLRYLKFGCFFDVSLAQKIIKNCSNPYKLFVYNDEILYEIPALPACLELDCQGCTGLTALPALPACQALNCQNCTGLKELPDLPACQWLNCKDCKGLKALPALSALQRLDCRGCMGLIQLPALPACQQLDCTACKALTALPDLPKCTKLVCNSCVKLKTLPVLSKCIRLDCKKCTELTAFPDLPLCQNLDCSGCTRLTAVPALPVCQSLYCQGCTGLIVLPALPECIWLDCQDCDALGMLPEVPVGCNVISVNDQGFGLSFATLPVDIIEFKRNPKKFVLLLANFLLKNQPFPSVQYFENGELNEAVDVGGLRRDFVTRILEYIFNCKTLLQDASHLSLDDGWPAIVAGKNEERCYETLGRLMGICTLSYSQLKTGPCFKEEFYECIGGPSALDSDEWYMWSLLTVKGIQRNLIDKLTAVSAGSENSLELDEKEKVYIKTLFNQFTNHQDDVEVLISDLNKLKGLVSKITEAAKEDPRVQAIYFIRKGIKDAIPQEWDTVRTMQVKNLQALIEGQLTKEILVEYITWFGEENSIVKTKEFFKEWMRTLNDEDMKKFVRIVTGLSALCSEKIKINLFPPVKTDADGTYFRFIPQAHTCFFRMDVFDNVPNQKEFNTIMQIFLDNGMGGETGFQTG